MDKQARNAGLLVLAGSAVLVCTVVGIFIGVSNSVMNAPPPPPNTPKNSYNPSATKVFSSYAVTSDSNVCSEIGKSIFQKNGSAVDATIATMLCMGVVAMQSNGIGGGNLAIIYDTPRNETKKKLVTLVSRETAPAGATMDMFKNASAQFGGLSIGIPGEIKGYYAAWQRFGRVPWNELVEPTAKLLEDGFVVDRYLDHAIKESTAEIMNSSSLKSSLSRSNNALYEQGDIYRDPKLAVTFRRIAANASDFYEGQLAKDIAEEIKLEGGIITEQDLRNYKVDWKDPTMVKLKGTNLTHYSLRPPSSGVVLGLILNIMAGYDLKPGAFSKENLTLTYHRLAEAFKFSYAGRSLMGDENFVNVSDLVDEMSSPAFAEYIRSRIDDSKTYNNASHYGGVYTEFKDHGTSHVSVYGADGSAVAMTSTINTYFGSKVKGRKTGIVYNNQMDDFSTPNLINYFGYAPSESNYIKPGKRPMSSMSPTLVMDSQNNVKFISGAAGGSRIITAIAGVLTNSMWANESLVNSTNKARIHHQLNPNVLIYDDWMDKFYVDGLVSKGHAVNPLPITAICNTIKINCVGPNCIEAVSDGRVGGGDPAGL